MKHHVGGVDSRRVQIQAVGLRVSAESRAKHERARRAHRFFARCIFKGGEETAGAGH
jgi:hypothetical protein